MGDRLTPPTVLLLNGLCNLPEYTHTFTWAYNELFSLLTHQYVMMEAAKTVPEILRIHSTLTWPIAEKTR